MNCIGIIGARKYKDRQSVIDLVNSLRADSIIITGSCRGVCTWAGQAGRARGLVVKIFSPDLTGIHNRHEMVERYYHRNRQLISACGIVHAFISQEGGFSGGTKFEVQYAERLGKDIFLHWENSVAERMCQKSLPFKSKENNLSKNWLNFFSEVLA